MTVETAAKRKRGRPHGTKNREHAFTAANAIRAGEFHDIYDAAFAHCQAHFRAKSPPYPSISVALKDERFRDFVVYIIEALRATIPLSEYGTLSRVLAKRNAHARIRHGRNSARLLRAELAKRPIEQLRRAVGLPSLAPDDN